jgi:hypothetical protein
MAEAAHKVEIRREKRECGHVVAHVVFDNARRLNVVNPAGPARPHRGLP